MDSHQDCIAVGLDRRPIQILSEGGSDPTILWLGGYASTMDGAKATALAEWGRAQGRRIVRFDYSGHGLSGGSFAVGTISRWLEEALAVLDHVQPRSIILAGSSMGGWIALLLAERLQRRTFPALSGLVLIAPAPDFTERLLLPRLTEQERHSLFDKGCIEQPSSYGSPLLFTHALVEDAKHHHVLDKPLALTAPIHIIHGMQDSDVPWAHVMCLTERLPHNAVTLTLIKDGDHRLSRPEDIARILEAVASIDRAPGSG